MLGELLGIVIQGIPKIYLGDLRWRLVYTWIDKKKGVVTALTATEVSDIAWTMRLIYSLCQKLGWHGHVGKYSSSVLNGLQNQEVVSQLLF